MSEPRDTQFAGFARMLLYELMLRNDINIDMTKDGWEEAWETAIAQRAYDLAQHVIGYSLEYLHECGVVLAVDGTTSGGMGKRIGRAIPDLTTWPETPKKP